MYDPNTTKQVSFSSVMILSLCDNILILKVHFLADSTEVKETMLICKGKYHFCDGNKLRQIKQNSMYLQEKNYEECMNKIMEEANRWCEDLKLPRLVTEF